MNTDAASSDTVVKPLLLSQVLLYAAGAVIAFHLAYSFGSLSCLMVVYFWCLFQLTRLKSTRAASYLGLFVGMLCYGPQLSFFWKIFGPAAIALWLVLAAWLALFLALGRTCRNHYGKLYAALLIPFLWTGLEYFRSELYYLRFSWLNAGYAFSDHLAWLPFGFLGMYGVGFALMAAVSLVSLLDYRRARIVTAGLVAVLAIMTNAPQSSRQTNSPPSQSIQVAGLQMEFPSELEVIFNLDRLAHQYPDAQLLALSEYTFAGPLPESVKAWCRTNHRYLVIGAEDPAPDSQYYDTAFVIGPNGDIVFRQGKCVPIQFFKDGLPAREQQLWHSPWGNIGFCVCYDLSYRRVTDELIRLGAQAIIVPTMDVVDWGLDQHELHARVAPVRAAEYGVPIFRIASSGISQCVNSAGQVLATAPMPGVGAMISGTLLLANPGTLPLDRFVAPLSVAATALAIVGILINKYWQRKSSRPALDLP